MKNRSRIVALFCLAVFAVSPNLYAFEPSSEDRALLEKISKDSFQYFLKMSDKKTGLTRDSSQAGSPCSVAATGFSLASFAIAQERGWIDREYARTYLEKTLTTLLKHADHEKGFFYHFLDMQTGRRVWDSEASSIDTALLVAGALLAGQYFPETTIAAMARKIYERIDWTWMYQPANGLICMGWKPETGFLPYYWDSYNELLILQALAIGSPTHPVPQSAWNAWARRTEVFNGKEIVYSYSGSLFTYQYSHAFIDFRNLADKGIDYFENSKKATTANWEYTLAFQTLFKAYTKDSWGVSASLGPGGYKAYGGKPGQGLHDGTIAPYASLGSIVFTPAESIAAAKYFYNTHRDQLYGMFGFKDAFNLDKHFWAQDYIGIDQGITILMIENFLHQGSVWGKFMALEAVKQWVALCGLAKPAPKLSGPSAGNAASGAAPLPRSSPA
ncbi:MAG: glucoamylase family protein [Candidatus Omnitrophota bacterium]